MKVGNLIKCINAYGNNVTLGKHYRVTGLDSDGDPEFVDDLGDTECFYKTSFEVVEESTPCDYIGKTVIYKGIPFKVEAFTVFNKYYPTNNPTIKREVEIDGYSYVLENDQGFAPLSEVTLLSNIVKLNDDYSAKIVGNDVLVGCQSIPIEKVKEIIRVWELNR